MQTNISSMIETLDFKLKITKKEMARSKEKQKKKRMILNLILKDRQLLKLPNAKISDISQTLNQNFHKRKLLYKELLKCGYI